MNLFPDTVNLNHVLILFISKKVSCSASVLVAGINNRALISLITSWYYRDQFFCTEYRCNTFTMSGKQRTDWDWHEVFMILVWKAADWHSLSSPLDIHVGHEEGPDWYLLVHLSLLHFFIQGVHCIIVCELLKPGTRQTSLLASSSCQIILNWMPSSF